MAEKIFPLFVWKTTEKKKLKKVPLIFQKEQKKERKGMFQG